MKPEIDPTDITMSENYVSRWLRAMRTDSRLTLAEKGFAGVLSTFATHETGRDCYPSNQRLTLLTGVSDRSIARYRNKLLSTGWLVMVREGGGLATTEVALTYPDPSLYDMTLWTRKIEGEVPQSTPDTSVTPDTPVTTPLTPVSPPPRHQCHPTYSWTYSWTYSERESGCSEPNRRARAGPRGRPLSLRADRT